MADAKPIYQSKTFWVAILTILMGVFEWVQGQQTSGATITVIGVVNVLLRLVTTQATSLFPE